ncbi:uncharacterized protein LOC126292140 [Schistocerca gregaria]|uniref:uncharacterized protein LOC126292140 n=1 Tax=Schistocerca gregaria TaxID=7010 RepID=UPI00211E2B30|nr:uncharacterized protein LOC126292140 [Schistocerca gregaria]
MSLAVAGHQYESRRLGSSTNVSVQMQQKLKGTAERRRGTKHRHQAKACEVLVPNLSAAVSEHRKRLEPLRGRWQNSLCKEPQE